ncbi:hexokinase-2 [Fundulus heteroclitus]|uniref:hexokinase-2 n=1 Tax=Fundulus heteroclitus TaxID=8078 RepID=UPI00165AE9F0|nr:hexokinase-2 [Fundulus heteroclitus]
MSNTETDNTFLLKDVPQEISSEVRQYLEPFCLSVEKLQDVSNRLLEAMKQGLDKQMHDNAPVKMLPTFVTATPDGTEQGDFLAVDLGGTNLRVFHVKLLPEANNLKIKAETEGPISQEIKDGPGEELFDYIATLISEILNSKDLKEKHVPLGFTFSFPCEQKSIDKSILIRWVKGFKCSGVEGEDVANLLKEAMKKKEDCDIGPVTMVNDAAGIMMSCRYIYPNCDIGMIIGTGTNACYMEEMKNIKYMEGEDGQMCINTEWGGFGDDGSLSDIQTEADKKVDENSNNSGVHIFEKMISGMYLGEIVGRVLLALTQKKLLFKGKVPEKLRDPTKFKSKYISDIEHEEKGLENAMGLLDCDEVDARIVQFVCATISSRAAHLCAAAVASIVKRICENRQLEQLKTTVGVDGSVYKFHPKISGKIKKMVERLAPKCKIDFKEVEDGSGKGAAIVSAVVQRLALKSGN